MVSGSDFPLNQSIEFLGIERDYVWKDDGNISLGRILGNKKIITGDANIGIWWAYDWIQQGYDGET